MENLVKGLQLDCNYKKGFLVTEGSATSVFFSVTIMGNFLPIGLLF